MIALVAAPIDPAALLAELAARAGAAGAIVSFAGMVRGEGGGVGGLRLDVHPVLTQSSLDGIGADTHSRFELEALTIVHRYGELVPGDPIVFVAAAAGHRRAAFDAVDYAMDRLKTDAVLWKQEMRQDGDRWIEPRPEDHVDAARWDRARI